MSDTTEVIVSPSAGDLSVVLFEEATIALSTGEAGPQGAPGVYVGPTPPANTSILWVDTS